MIPLFANDIDFFPPTFWPGVVATLVYGPIGIVLMLLGIKAFDWIMPKLDIQKELVEKTNIPVAIVCAALILGICYIVASIVH